MTDIKYNISDTDIPKALNDWAYDLAEYAMRYEDFPLVNKGIIWSHHLLNRTADLINRQKEEIERLKSRDLQIEVSKKLEREIKAEAIKEFAERLEKKIFPYGMPDNGNYGINAEAVKVACEKTAKEMVGESNG